MKFSGHLQGNPPFQPNKIARSDLLSFLDREVLIDTRIILQVSRIQTNLNSNTHKIVSDFEKKNDVQDQHLPQISIELIT